MRTAIILGRKHGGKQLVVVSGPEKPVREQRDLFKNFRREGSSADFESVELWESDSGRKKETNLDHPEKKTASPVPKPGPKFPIQHPAKPKAHSHGRDKDEVD